MTPENPVSVVIPMFNGGRLIGDCLTPLLAMLEHGLLHEIIVVDDGSSDNGPTYVQSLKQVQLLSTGKQAGPGAARNLGADRATGNYLWFVDCDVMVANDAGQVVHDELKGIEATPDVVAVIGLYDTAPRAGNFLSQYKNLVHHYYHARASTEAQTFWSGCGLVKRQAFLDVGGFDYPSVEDIDLGYRLRDAGGRIRLNKQLQGKHLKEWRLPGLLHTEIFLRAIPWSRLMLERQEPTDELNVATAERFRALAAGGLLAWILLVVAGATPVFTLLLAMMVILAVNIDFFRFFLHRKGLLFAIRALAFHQFYYLYSAISFSWVWLVHRTHSIFS